MMHDPFLHIEASEADAIPRPGSWWILALLLAAIAWGAAWGIYDIGRRMVDAILALGFPV
jgi:hypothetical protein